MKKKNVLLSVLTGMLFLFCTSDNVFASVDGDKIIIFPESEDGYVTSWIDIKGVSKELWNLTHDTNDYLRVDSDRSFIETASGWSSDSRFFIHRARMPFDLSELENKIVKDVTFKIRIRHATNSLNDGDDFIVLIQASTTNMDEINYSDYEQIGESLMSGWGNAHKNDIIEISNRIDISSVSIGDVLEFKLKEEFVDKLLNKESIILGLREGHDLLNLYPVYPEAATANRIHFYSMNEVDFNYHPYLEVTYEIPEEINEPLILIPGIMGSWPVNGELVLDPMLNTYENLWEALIASGYEENVDLFAFPYEWRNSNTITSDILAQKIEEVKTLTGTDKVDIVAHSMGGLVAREYLSDEDNLDNVDQLIFLATPHRGSPKSYLTWGGGVFGSGFSESIKTQIFKQEAKENSYDDIYSYLRGANVYSVKELLPVFDYLRDKDSGELKEYPYDYPENIFLDNLNNESALTSLNSIGVLNLVALGHVDENKTLNIINVGDECTEDRWVYGCPDNYELDFEYSNGDMTVPERSNSHGFDFETYSLISSHNRIVTDAQQDVIERLTGERPSEFIDTAKIDKKMLLFQMFSPVDMQIRNEAGQMLGKDFDLDRDIMDIDGSYYSGFESLAEFASILSPAVGIYNIDLQGVANGKYKLVTSYITETGIIQEEFIGSIYNGEIKNLTINFTEDNIEIVILSGFEKILFDLETLNNSGEIKKDRIYKKIKNKIESLEKRYKKVETKKTLWKRKMLTRIIKIRLRMLKKQLNFYERKGWISSEAGDVLGGDIKYLINVL